MGMFDEVVAQCPKCDSPVEFQTKAGPCLLKRFDAERGVPPEIAVDIQFDSETCLKCGATVELVPTMSITNIPMCTIIKQ